MEINEKTLIDVGLQISKNFLIDHFSTGAYHPAFGEILPKYPAKLIPALANNMFSIKGAPLWKIAQNLQIGSGKIVENLFSEFGSDLIIRSGFLNNIPASGQIASEALHLLGRSFDVSIKGQEDNMFSMAKDIQRIANKASNMQLVFGSSSWIHFDVDPKRAMDNATRIALPAISTVDTVLGVVEQGIHSFRGF